MGRKPRMKEEDVKDRKKYRGKRDAFRRQDQAAVKTGGKEYENDASWYTRNTQLTADSGRIAFTWPTGIGVDVDFDVNKLSGVTANNTSVINGYDPTSFKMPGVMALKYVPTYGLEHNGVDALNIAAQNVFTSVRKPNSGNANYDPVDLMLYLTAMDQIYSLYMHLVRAYGCISLFSQRNRNFPKVLLNALGFDYDDLRTQLADFRYNLNNAATRIQAMCVPNSMPIFVRHMWMASMLFTDGNSQKAQIYAFRPISFGKYNEKDSSNGGFLEAIFMDKIHPVSEWLELLNDMINAVRASGDCGVMSGDILKAYDTNGLFQIPFISENFTTNIAYSTEVLGQIANTTIMPGPAYMTFNNKGAMLYQDVNENQLKAGIKFVKTSVSNANLASQYEIYTGKRVMVGLSQSPTPEEVMVNSRLMVIAKEIEYKNSAVTVVPETLGTEVVCEGAMYDVDNLETAYDDANVGRMDPTRYIHYYNNVSGVDGALTTAALVNYFNLHPAVVFGNYTLQSNKHTLAHFFDVDDFAIVGGHEVAKMHETALLSLFDVPMYGQPK